MKYSAIYNYVKFKLIIYRYFYKQLYKLQYDLGHLGIIQFKLDVLQYMAWMLETSKAKHVLKGNDLLKTLAKQSQTHNTSLEMYFF